MQLSVHDGHRLLPCTPNVRELPTGLVSSSSTSIRDHVPLMLGGVCLLSLVAASRYMLRLDHPMLFTVLPASWLVRRHVLIPVDP